MEPIGFTECSFDMNGRSFTQKFIVCNNQTRPIILGKDFASKNCIGIVWTKQGARRVDLQDADITPGTRSTFDVLYEKYPKVFSKGNEDIGRTQLVTMDIDTGDSPPVSSRPYTLALKHHRWVQEEIETLKRAGVITKSMSPWARLMRCTRS